EIDNLVSGYNYKDTVMSYVEFMNDRSAFAIGDNKFTIFRGNQKPESVFEMDITENIKTIHSIPLSIQYKGFAAVRGEVYIDKSDFAKINAGLPKEEQYANARNLASGAVRRQKSKEAAEIPLKMFCYEIFLRENQIKNHLDSLIFMKNLGFPVNDLIGFYTREPKEGSAIPSVPFKNAMTGDTNSIGSCIQALTEQRSSLPYDIDGIVIKINDLETREEMGYTQHHPRWAIAYKFDAPLAETVINSISVQVGRGGRITPVANLQPVPLAGSVIARATLHNQDYINSLEVNVGDLVSISKRGDVIPAVEGVLEKRTNPAPFKLPEECPSCHSKLIVEGAHTFCPNKQCPARMLGTLQFFVSRTQMDIVSLGDKTLEYMFRNNCIRYIPDIYTFDYSRLIGVEGFGQKKVDNIIESVMKSKEKPYQTVLASLGLKDIGNKAAEVLTHIFRSVDDLIALCADTSEAYTALTQINGIGEMLANQIIEHFTNKDVLELIDSLKKCGLQFQTKETVSNDNQFLAGTKWVITGSFEHYKPRTIAGDIIKQYGGEVIDSVSGKTTHLLCGISPGSKLDKAKSLGTTIISEEQFIQIIEQQSL
ncbi:MAG: NAD-dependent DNA ligase LigA, partial [Spirochaetales bacterium]|nr:NAD-dependent DNA ligase LigA [Spirochaetales bacterium]